MSTDPRDEPGLPERTDARLAALDHAPVEEHASIFAAVHRDLRDALGDTDPGPTPD